MASTQETPQARAGRYIKELDKKQYTQGEVKTLLLAIESLPEKTPVAPIAMTPATSIRRGDVFIAPGVGGKNRPWAVTQVYSDYVVALALSSGDNAHTSIELDCRFWNGSWIGGATAQFELDKAKKGVTRPLTNMDQLAEAEAATILALMGEGEEAGTLADNAVFESRRAA